MALSFPVVVEVSPFRLGADDTWLGSAIGTIGNALSLEVRIEMPMPMALVALVGTSLGVTMIANNLYSALLAFGSWLCTFVVRKPDAEIVVDANVAPAADNVCLAMTFCNIKRSV